jgi:ribosome-associated protein
MREVEIFAEPVALFKILKFEGMAPSGGEAKAAIAAGQVRVNGDIETRKRRQIRSGDVIEFAGETIRVRCS